MELDCRQCDEGLVEFVYGEFDEKRSAAFERHLQSCPKCASTADQLRQTSLIFADLEPAEPPTLAADDPLFAAIQAKADEMAISAERLAAAAADQRPPSLWDRLLAGLRSAAMRPALGTALLVVLVAGVGVVYLSDRSQPQSLSGMAEETTPLSEVPLEEVRTAQSPNIPPVGPLARLEPEPLTDETTAQALPEEEDTPAVAQQPVRPRPSEARRPLRPIAPPTKRPALKQAARGPATAERLDAPAPAPRRAEGQLLSSPGVAAESLQTSPIVVDAQQVPSGLASPTMDRSLASPPSQPAQAPIIATPPLPEAGAYQRQPNRQQQAPTPLAVAPAPPPATNAQAPQVQQPTRVATPGQERYRRGMEAYRTGRYRDAADELNEFVRSPSAPSHLMPSGLHHLAMSQRRTGNLSTAANTYDQLLRRHRGYERRAQALVEAAEVNARLGRYGRAESQLRELAAIPGWSDRAQSELARLQHRRAGAPGGEMGPDSALENAEDAAEAPAEADEPAAASPGF